HSVEIAFINLFIEPVQKAAALWISVIHELTEQLGGIIPGHIKPDGTPDINSRPYQNCGMVGVGRPMFDYRRAANVRAEVIRLSKEGRDSHSLRAQAIRKLRFVIPVDSYWFATADPESLLFTDSLVEDIPEAATPLFVANEFLQDDVNKWARLA